MSQGPGVKAAPTAGGDIGKVEGSAYGIGGAGSAENQVKGMMDEISAGIDAVMINLRSGAQGFRAEDMGAGRPPPPGGSPGDQMKQMYGQALDQLVSSLGRVGGGGGFSGIADQQVVAIRSQTETLGRKLDGVKSAVERLAGKQNVATWA